MRLIRDLMKFLWVFSLLAVMFYMWQIDVSVGALSSGGVVFQDRISINPLEYYEKSIYGVMIWGFINMASAYVLIFFRTIWTRTIIKYVPEKQNNKKPRKKKDNV